MRWLLLTLEEENNRPKEAVPQAIAHRSEIRDRVGSKKSQQFFQTKCGFVKNFIDTLRILSILMF
ncbi:hypothetical protein [Allocoleopsis franciscana]|uniref:Uncharacterized protein n=1 Tax=Allocoleopsis franciscana PCC 7113 TaxID=1173027 RepID=K9WJR2_9CYAN|nr:hypothetical protein [Allocoleopsis franciscana]AFZ20630.1 hypothetical protein Mic7113_4969 [Allocoleopsis franciscana PCC 7113]